MYNTVYIGIYSFILKLKINFYIVYIQHCEEKCLYSYFRSIRHNNGTILSRSRTFYTNSDLKPNNPKKNVEYNKGYKNHFQPMKNTQQRDTQVILNNIIVHSYTFRIIINIDKYTFYILIMCIGN